MTKRKYQPKKQTAIVVPATSVLNDSREYSVSEVTGTSITSTSNSNSTSNHDRNIDTEAEDRDIGTESDGDIEFDKTKIIVHMLKTIVSYNRRRLMGLDLFRAQMQNSTNAMVKFTQSVLISNVLIVFKLIVAAKW